MWLGPRDFFLQSQRLTCYKYALKWNTGYFSAVLKMIIQASGEALKNKKKKEPVNKGNSAWTWKAAKPAATLKRFSQISNEHLDIRPGKRTSGVEWVRKCLSSAHAWYSVTLSLFPYLEKQCLWVGVVGALSKTHHVNTMLDYLIL